MTSMSASRPQSITWAAESMCQVSTSARLRRITHILLDHRLRLLDIIARESRIRGEIIELRNKSVHFVHKDPHLAVAIAARLSQWWSNVGNLESADHGQHVSRYHLTIFTLLKHESIISLHRPILAASRRGDEYNAALQLCIDSAQFIITLLYNAIVTKDGPHNNQPLHLLWPSCTWAIWISTFILFYAASNNSLSRAAVIR